MKLRTVLKRECLEIFADEKIVSFDFKVTNQIIEFNFNCFLKLCESVFIEALNLFTNKMIKLYHPLKLLIKKNDLKEYKHAFYLSMYYEYHDAYMREVEDFRYLISDKVFDDEGYIINQGLLKNIKFKAFTSDKKGCGWIAVYNLFKIMHQEKTLKKVHYEISRMALFFGLVGQDIFTIYYYLRKQGINAYLTLFSKKSCINDIRKSKCGIILYMHKKGMHYTAYKKLNNMQCLLYNVVYGKKNHIMDIEEFYKIYSVSSMGMLIAVDEV